MDRKITFSDVAGKRQSRVQNTTNGADAPHPDAQPGASRTHKEELYKERPEPVYIPGQGLSADDRKRKQTKTLRYGYERLGHMYSLRIPVKFEELQGRHPFDYIEETREHFRLHPDPVKKPAQPEDPTLFDVREWLEPLIRKGQLYFDYCRDKWLEKESKLGAACAPICCMYSLWSITGSCLQYGGLVFMAVYLFLTLVFIIPLIYMELAIGQFHRQGLVKAIKQTCPLFKGLAYLMLISCLFDYLLSMTRITWLFYYIQNAVQTPWKDCNHDWASSHCKEVTSHHQTNWTSSGSEKTPAVEWYRVHVSRPWNHWRIIHKNPRWYQVIIGLLPDPRILISFLCLVWLIKVLMKRWCNPLGRFMLFIFYAAFILSGFSLLSFRHTFPRDTLPVVIDWLLRVDHLKHLYSKNAWTTALKHAVISSGVGTGIYITFGTHNTFPHDELKRMSVLTGLISFVVHCVVAFFFIFCHFTIRDAPAFSNTTADNYGSDTVFEVYPQVIAEHHQQGIGYLMFTAMTVAILLYASLRVLASLHTIRQYFFDRDKGYYEPVRVNYNYWEHDKIKRQQRYVNLQLGPQRKGQLITKILLIAGIFHVATFFSGGSTVLFVMEMVWYNCIPVFILMVECVAVFFFAGIRMVNEYIRKMTTWHVTLWYRFMWKIMIPSILVLYIAHPPQRHLIISEGETNDLIDLIGHILCLLPFLFIYLCSMYSWRTSRAKNCCAKLRLEASPEHEHAGMIAGRKPSTRLHWMHHLHVPSGISRGLCLPSYEGPPRKPNVYRLYWENILLNFLWYTLKFKWLNAIKDGCIEYEDPNQRFFHLFRPIPYPVKPPKKEKPIPDYLPNEAIKRVHKLKKYKDFTKQRKAWLNEKVELERERMAAEHDERDIEAGIIGLSAAARQAQAEDEEHEFFDMFDVSSGEEVFDTDTSTTTEDSWGMFSDDDGVKSSPSVSTSDSFESQNSIFGGSGEDGGELSWKASTKTQQDKESDSSSDGEDDQDDGMAEMGVDDSDDYGAPVMDYGADEDAPVPFDDDTDSWELEELERFEDNRGYDFLDKDTSEAETDTDGLVEALEESKEESSEDDEEGDSEDDEGNVVDDEEFNWIGAPGGAKSKVSLAMHGEKHAKKESSSEESNSWSTSCGSDLSCESSDFEDDSSDDESEPRIRGASFESQEDDGKNSAGYHPRHKKTGDRSVRISFFRSIAERLDTFLHISQKQEKERIPMIHKAVEKQKREEKLHEKEMEKIE